MQLKYITKGVNMIKNIMNFISEMDPEVGAGIIAEYERQQNNIELIASENQEDCLCNLRIQEGYSMKAKIVLIPGDGIGPEIVGEAEKVLRHVAERFGQGHDDLTSSPPSSEFPRQSL